MGAIWRDEKYSTLSKRLVDVETKYCGQKILPNYRDLIIFSAMVGFHFGKNSPVIDKAYEIPQRVFETNESDVYIYLCALQHQKSGDIFREQNENECWKIFESYANSGLGIIDDWLMESPGDIDGVETILNKMKVIAAEIISTDEILPDLDDIVF
jgi:dnd system-associated protein 4